MEKQILKVKSIEDEYRIIDKSRCKCGGRFISVMQALEPGNIDLVLAKCSECDNEKEFRFDISGMLDN